VLRLDKTAAFGSQEYGVPWYEWVSDEDEYDLWAKDFATPGSHWFDQENAAPTRRMWAWLAAHPVAGVDPNGIWDEQRRYEKWFLFTAGRSGKTHKYWSDEFTNPDGPQRAKDAIVGSRGRAIEIPEVRIGPYNAPEPADVAYWLFKGKFYVTEALDLDESDVFALMTEKENRQRLKLEKAHAVLAMTQRLDQASRRQNVPQVVRVAVWQRDGGRCVECGSQSDLEFDHVIPISMGGSNTERNLQLLCESCNRTKGATLG
jgi:hypothetical protein